MKFLLGLAAVAALSGSCATTDAPVVSRHWEMQEDGHYIFESNNPYNAGMISYKGWSGFQREARLLSAEFTPLSGGRGMVFGLKIEVSETEVLPLLVMDHKGQYNLLDPRTHRPLNEEWGRTEDYRMGQPVLLEARKEGDSWVYSINRRQVGAFRATGSDARYGAVLYTAYGRDLWGAPTDFPRKKILLEFRVLEAE